MSSDTSLVLRVNSGSKRLSNFSSVFLTLGLLTSVVPELIVNFLGLAYPFRWPLSLSESERRTDLAPPQELSNLFFEYVLDQGLHPVSEPMFQSVPFGP